MIKDNWPDRQHEGNLPRGDSDDTTALPSWLIPAVGTDLPGRAAALLREGQPVVLLSGPDEKPSGLPPARADEIAGAPARDRSGYLLRRQIARAVAAAFGNCDAGAVSITPSPNGAPLLTGPVQTLHVSFSTRGGYCLVGLARHPLGVDLELPITPEAIPWNMLRKDEREHLAALAPETRQRAFMTLWSRKEAVVKALKSGFSTPPEAVRISLDKTLCASEITQKISVLDREHEFLCRGFWLNAPKGSHVSLALLSRDAG